MDESKKKIVKSETEWREALTPEQYRVLREQGTERPFTGDILGHRDSRHVSLRGMRSGALPLRREVRRGVRLAELLQAGG